MDPENVVKVVKQMATLPLDANIQFVTIMATKMPLMDAANRLKNSNHQNKKRILFSANLGFIKENF